VAIDYAVLKTELQTDPRGMDYATPRAAGNDTTLADLLNSPTGAGSGTVTVPSLARNDFLLALAPAYLVLPSLSQALQAKWDRILAVIRAADRIDLANPSVQALLAQAVTDGVLTQAQVNALGQRVGSRAEVLFGAGTVVSIQDVGRALQG
jgi:hypothetical protein